ncbi:Putative Zinc finger, PHD-type, Zinc finger, FYVE/PHD-type, Zinc finger, RING/FYVE/PHD-type [Septoria linicola]|uniref:Zinc finger, PHD-type, Zinc finger, FYVE/PHD-type, Zinc finger, RING/FYVE/PHD-type n=1 Tax=Septoria linicola TaxID=215465 RepID=A0A9Q9EKN2_9PEZI|nr:putative Zinc finger, PHD-type, Zinc finger, FYVE/PHD-type, Zinc finger, RING/FYVE/PHD-type [Septoria linicola]USW52563.1 Putative Zinc finger, PHD-type, Zinc finger, FYVE/PHD-type, Zinc finger, RING/FYVE/PHD-type [Septoria linicola]
MVYREDGDIFGWENHNASPTSCEVGWDESSSSESGVELEEQPRKTVPSETCCLCHGKETASMIQCDGCNGWYHYSCVALSPIDPPKIAMYFCPTCYRAGKGQSIWRGGAIFSKQQNRRVHGQILRRTIHGRTDEVLARQRQGQSDRPPPAAPGFRYERQREFYVKRLADGTFTTLNGLPVIIDPPHNAPLPQSVVAPTRLVAPPRDEKRAFHPYGITPPVNPLLALPGYAAQNLGPLQEFKPMGLMSQQLRGMPFSSASSCSMPMANPLRPLSSARTPPVQQVSQQRPRLILKMGNAAISGPTAAASSARNGQQERGARSRLARPRERAAGQRSLIVKLRLGKNMVCDVDKSAPTQASRK